ncbi:hypothetical protein M413DRAFT_30198 [Hebeloma cylindrosporum]|uniref:Uncharacterized protein n=1 Tax=Hebeloma cylindrosporum TaxID=76867 RepID=A0A0C2XKR6_HEBCY|nr:hypothetical protein M413DRAFT_30198 [Hebeloma cylindrosporum h7]
MEYASGKREFKRGAFIGSISSAQTTNPIPLELRDALELDYLDKRVISPYEKRNQILLDYAGGLKPLEVPAKLSLDEAAGIFEVWKGVQAFGKKGFPYDEAFLAKYTESSGNARDFVRKGILSSMDA